MLNINNVIRNGLFSAIGLGCLIITGCASLYDLGTKIPGIDRILHKDSKAEVGPVETVDGDIIEGTNTSTDLPLPTEVVQAPESGKENSNKSQLSTTEGVRVEQSLEQPSNSSADLVVPPATLSGKITLLAKSGEISPEGVIVRLKRTDGVSLATEQKIAEHNLNMVNKTYTPGQKIVRKGDVLNFVNQDKIQHNVFSSSDQNAFDLGTYGSGLKRAVRLNEDGIVKVYCNIHPGMATFIAVDDFSLSQLVDADTGSYEFTLLPATEYQLTLWSIRGEKVETFSLNAGESKVLDIEFDTSAYRAGEHANKFGESYQKNTNAYQGDVY